MPMISAASYQVIFLTMARIITSCTFMVRSIAACEKCFMFLHKKHLPYTAESGHFICYLNRHIMCYLQYQKKLLRLVELRSKVPDTSIKSF